MKTDIITEKLVYFITLDGVFTICATTLGNKGDGLNNLDTIKISHLKII